MRPRIDWRTGCNHRQYNVELDIESHGVYCSNCGALLDAFDVLVEFANDERIAKEKLLAIREVHNLREMLIRNRHLGIGRT